MRALRLAWIGCVLALALPAAAFPSYGNYVDTTCTANGWVPARPYNPNRLNTTNPSKVNCGLCHANAASPGKTLSVAGKTFKSSGFTNVSPFCAPPAPMNHAPVFFAIAPQQAMLGRLFQLAVAATDADRDAIALSVSNSPAGASFSDAGNGTGTFQWTPGMAQAGNLTVTFHATDGGSPMASATLDVAISVGAVSNRPPTLAAVGDQRVEPGVQLTVTFSATDPDGNALTFAVQPLPSGATLSGNLLAWMPSAGQVGSYPVTVRVTDDGTPSASDSEAIVITVGRVNRPPLLSPIGNRTVDLGQSARIAIMATDPDLDALVLACSGLPTGASFTDMRNGTGEILFAPTVASANSATCSATDNGLPPGAAQETFMLTARDPAPPAGAPVIDEAAWDDAHGGSLSVHGNVPASALPTKGPKLRVDVFAVLADGTLVNLGRRIVGHDGSFQATLPTFIAPCQIAAGANGAISSPLAVSDAPASCNTELLMDIRVQSSCSGFQLRAKGRHAAPGGVVLATELATGDALFQETVTPRGTFAAKTRVGAFVHALDVRVQAAGHEWALPAPLAVTSACGN